MELVWLGHSCFRIRAKEATVVTDPFDKRLGYPLGRVAADIVTVSHGHGNHSSVESLVGSPRVLRAPGEYEVAKVLITGVASFHATEAERERTIIFVFEMEDITVCHLGGLRHVPTAEETEQLSGVQVLLIPVGGVHTIGATEAAETVGLLEPRIVVPMHFRTEQADSELEPVTHFLREMGTKDVEPQPRLTVTRGSLPADTQVVVLDYRH